MRFTDLFSSTHAKRLFHVKQILSNPFKALHPSRKRSLKPKAPRATSVRIYTNAEELVGKPFRDLGEVSGDSCRL